MAEEAGRRVASIAAMASDLGAIAGAGSVAYGAWLIYPPAGFIVGGSILLTVGIAGAMLRSR